MKKNRNGSRVSFWHNLLDKCRQRFFIILTVFLITIGILYSLKLLHETRFFRIETIKSNVNLPEYFKKDIVGKSLLTIDIKGLYNQIISKYPEFRDIYILKEFPSVLTIHVDKREPAAQIKSKNFYIIDKDGMILDERKNGPFADVICVDINGYKERLKKGRRIQDKRLGYVFDLIENLKKSGLSKKFSISTVNATSLDNLYFAIGDINKEDTAGIKVIVGRSGYDKKLTDFMDIMNKQFKGDISLVQYVDLRFNEVYIGYKEVKTDDRE